MRAQPRVAVRSAYHSHTPPRAVGAMQVEVLNPRGDGFAPHPPAALRRPHPAAGRTGTPGARAQWPALPAPEDARCNIVRHLSQRQVDQLIPGIVENVRRQTGLALEPPVVKVRSREEIVRVTLENAAAQAPSMSWSSRFNVLQEALAIAYQSLGFYEPERNQVTIVQQSVEGMHIQDVCGVLHHELIHAAQQQNFPGFMNYMNCLGVFMSHPNPAIAAEARARYDLGLRLVEGHAYLMHAQSVTQFYPKGSAQPVPLRWPAFIKTIYRGALEKCYLNSPYSGAETLKASGATGEDLNALIATLFQNADFATLVMAQGPQAFNSSQTSSDRGSLAHLAPGSDAGVGTA